MDELTYGEIQERKAQRIVESLNAKLKAAFTPEAAAAAQWALEEAIREEQDLSQVRLDVAARIVYRPPSYVRASELKIRNASWQLLGALVRARHELKAHGQKVPEEVMWEIRAAIQAAVGSIVG